MKPWIISAESGSSLGLECNFKLYNILYYYFIGFISLDYYSISYYSYLGLIEGE